MYYFGLKVAYILCRTACGYARHSYLVDLALLFTVLCPNRLAQHSCC